MSNFDGSNGAPQHSPRWVDWQNIVSTLRNCRISSTISIVVCHTCLHHRLHHLSIFLGFCFHGLLVVFKLDYVCIFYGYVDGIYNMWMVFGIFVSGCFSVALILSLSPMFISIILCLSSPCPVVYECLFILLLLLNGLSSKVGIYTWYRVWFYKWLFTMGRLCRNFYDDKGGVILILKYYSIST